MGEISKTWSPHLGAEAKTALSIAIPMIMTNLISFSILASSLMFVGHLGPSELSSAALGNSLGSVTGFTVMLGLASGLDTLCGQAFGAKKFHLLGIYYQTSAFVLLCTCVPISVLWWNMEPVLLVLGQDAEIAGHTMLYMRAMLPALWAFGVIQATIKYLQTQSIVLPIMICSLITFLLHVPLTYFLVYSLGVGYRGGAWSICISYWILMFELLVYVAYSESRRAVKTWTGFACPKLDTMWLYLKLAVPAAFMIILQFWAFELLVFLSGLMPNPEREVSLLSICLNTAGLAFAFPFGLSAASSTRVSNEVGSGNIRGAKYALKVVMGISVSQATIVSLALILLRDKWGWAFSSDSDIIKEAAGILPFLAFGLFMDGIQGVLGGGFFLSKSQKSRATARFILLFLGARPKAMLVSALRGCGLQGPATIINIIAFYGVGVPSAILFGFYFKWGGKGLYGGCICGTITQLTLIAVLVALINWDKQIENAQSRIGGIEKGTNENTHTGDIHEPLLTA